mmetsp:Transcript_9437/g.21626  ORF Transcript_9437/g.21626 Transcript_9437/m.21626 type:complete len:223 (-) Transcript_9437:56-724(-)
MESCFQCACPTLTSGTNVEVIGSQVLVESKATSDNPHVHGPESTEGIETKDRDESGAFEVNITGQDLATDLYIDTMDERYCMIANIVNVANITDSTGKVAPGMFITKVNDVSGSSSRMWEQLKGKTSAKLTVRHPKLIKVNVVKTGNLCMSISTKNDFPIFIIKEVNPGPIATWNEQHPDKAVMPNDRMIEVNGISGDHAKILEAIKKDGNVSITFSRCVLD